jgi:Ubiquitin-activating enzyme E1 FCCH domain/Baseplate J-like protein
VTDLPVIMTTAGAQPTPPATIRAALVAQVAQTDPGYTANLPGALIEDVSSTEVAGIAEMDSARVDAINSISPAGANDFVLYQLGQIYIGEPGGAPGTPTNVSVSVVFTAVDPNTSLPITGLVIPQGFVVSDGIYQYVVQDDGVTGASGQTPPLFCLATIAGTWGVASGTVAQLVTSEPTAVNLTCSNPLPGTAGNAAETAEEYRARVFQAGQAVSTGTTTLLKTLLGQVSGVQQRLISVRQSAQLWEVIVGGGDPYQVAGAIFESGLNIAGLTGSTLNITNITQANPGVVTTDKNHGYSTGEVVTMTGIVGMTPLNGTPVTITVIDEKNFSIGVNTGVMPSYISGGVCSPNLRNVLVNISDPPDIYGVTFVTPPQQTVTVAVTWNTTQANFASQASVAQLAATAIAAYINSIPVAGPISVAVLTQIFIDAVAGVLDPETISVLTFAVSINGVSTPPTGQLIFGDPESYMFCTVAGIAVTQS